MRTQNTSMIGVSGRASSLLLKVPYSPQFRQNLGSAHRAEVTKSAYSPVLGKRRDHDSKPEIA